MNNKNIFIVFPSLKISGGNKELIKLSEYLKLNYFSVMLIIMWRSHSEITDTNVKVVNLTNFYTSKYLAILQIPIIFCKFVMKYYSACTGDNYWIFTHFTTLPLSLFVRPEKCIFFVQGIEWKFIRNKYISILMKSFILYCYKRGKVVTTNGYLTDNIISVGINICSQLPIWADTQFYVQGNNLLRTIDYIMVVRKGSVKRLDLYVDFIKCLNKESQFRRVVAITPDEDIALMFSNLGIEVILRPSVPNMRDLYSRSKIFIMLSDQEGFGLPPLEAMGSGCVPICRDSGGIKEYMVDEFSSLIFPLDMNISTIVEISEKLIISDNLYDLSLKAKKIFHKGLCRVEFNEIKKIFK